MTPSAADLMHGLVTDLSFLDGGGEMGERMRDHDWSTSPLGELSQWPQSLRSVVGLMINSRYPMFCAWGADLGFLYNDGYAPILGARHPQALGRPFREIWSDIWDGIGPLVDAAMAGRSTYEENLHLVMERNGYPEDTWYNFSYSPIRDESGAIAGMFCACTETTQAFIAERALTQREAHLRAVFEQISEGVIMADAEGRLSFINRSAKELHGVADLGAAPDEYSDTYHLFTEEGAPYPSEQLPLARAALNGEVVENERWRIRRPDGSEVLAIGSARPIRDDNDAQIGAVLTIRDDTLRWSAEAEVRESESRFRSLADQSPMMVWVTEPDGTCIFLSRSWYDFTGQDEADALGFGWLEAVHPDDRERAGETFRDANAAQVDFRFEYRLLTADGDYRWAIDAATPSFAPDGRYLGYVGSVVDIHDRKQIEETLAARVSQELERRLRAEQALVQSQKLETLGQLTGGVAHDFNNLLTPIVGALDMVQKRLSDDARATRLVGGAIQAADRARILVQRLLAFSRRQLLTPQAVDVAALVEGVADLLRRSLGPRIELVLDLANDLAPAHVDPNQLELALINLAVNARDAMPDGGTVSIAARTDPIEHHPRLGDGTYIRLDVADTGVGMDADTLARAVEPFFTTKGIGEGTGLGLSAVQGLALQSGGELALTSEPGRGTTATLWLPVSSEVPKAVAIPVKAASHSAEGATILLVDDEPLVRSGLADMLAGMGFEVVEASSANAAWGMIEQGLTFDAVITDHAMPGMTGSELSRLIRERFSALPVLVVTGYAHVAVETHEDLEIMSKPFRAAELGARLAAMLAGRQTSSPSSLL